MRHHPSAALPPEELTARIALNITGCSGDPVIGTALHHYGTARALLAAIHDHDELPGLDPQHIREIRNGVTPAEVVRVLTALTCPGFDVLIPGDAGWPTRLDELGILAPLALFTRGDAQGLQRPAIAVTGSTAPALTARRATLELATSVADEGWPIAATARPGVDRLALTAANALGGPTIVLGTTLDEGATLAGGQVMVSENPPGVPIRLDAHRRVPMLLAGIASHVVVIGAALASGALHAGVAARRLHRPVGLADTGTVEAGDARLNDIYRVPFVRTLVDVERLT